MRASLRGPLRGLCLALCAVLLWTAGALALDVPPHGGQFVVDLARLLPQRDKDALGAELRRYAQESGNQIVVLTIPSLMGEDVAGYANRVARAWGVGQKDKNNGVLILVAAAERKVRFEVGRGVEDRLPDITARRIQREVTLPHFKAGRFGPGLAASVQAIQAALGPPSGSGSESGQGAAEPSAPQLPPRAPAEPDFPWLTLGLIVLAVVLMLSLAGRRRASRGYYDQDGRFVQDEGGSSFFLGFLLGMLANIFRGRGGGGGFGGGGFGGGSGGDGGFSGGGGDFGGGGSSSDWGGGDDNN